MRLCSDKPLFEKNLSSFVILPLPSLFNSVLPYNMRKIPERFARGFYALKFYFRGIWLYTPEIPQRIDSFSIAVAMAHPSLNPGLRISDTEDLF